MSELLQIAKMLLGKHFRRRHPHRLVALFDHLQGSQPSHHGFAGTDIALHQAVHGMISGEIALDFPQYSRLRTGKFERQQLLHARGQVVVGSRHCEA